MTVLIKNSQKPTPRRERRLTLFKQLLASPLMAKASAKKSFGGIQAKPSLTRRISEKILAQASSPEFNRYIQSLLLELCRIDTTPDPEIARMRSTEEACFKILERELNRLNIPELRVERRPIDPLIEKHPAFSLLHFTKTAKRPGGLSPEETYAGRSNLVFILPASSSHKRGLSLALNAHIDVVAPFFPPKLRNGTVFGRGACDDKGPVVSIVAALKLLSEVMPPLRLNRNLVGMFVVEEETGGNGSLSLALDRELRRFYDSILVGECTSLKIYPANRGAVWYRAGIQAPNGVSAFEVFAFINEEMEKEGAAIRAESHHPLFPQRPVQTCHGIIGPFGEHPSRICGEAQFTVRFARNPGEQAARLLQDALESGLASYIGLYGDKTAVTDPATDRPMVRRHYEMTRRGGTFLVTVYGATGHMGAIRERDGAITKMAHLVRALVFSRARLESAGGRLTMALAGRAAEQPFVLEGGQGFVPTHQIDEVMSRMRAAAERGAENYLRRIGNSSPGKTVVTVTYEKLHNVAFDGDPNSTTMINSLAAAKNLGLPTQEPVLGWTVSCDARLFATEYPDLEVVTFGPGELVFAHSDQEQIQIDHIRKAAAFLAKFILIQTGTTP